MNTASYTVHGLTCEHCVASVTEEVQEVPGVRSVTVDLTSGSLTIESNEPVSSRAVEAAVREAGFSLT